MVVLHDLRSIAGLICVLLVTQSLPAQTLMCKEVFANTRIFEFDSKGTSISNIADARDLIHYSDRIVLRKPQIIDRNSYIKIMTDPKVQEMENMSWDRGSAIQSFESLLGEGNSARSNSFSATIVDRQSKKVIGFIFLYKNEMGQWELGYDIAPNAWGKGYATESVMLFLNSHSDIYKNQTVVARIADSNIGSQRVVEKIGFKYSKDEATYGSPKTEKTKVYVLNPEQIGPVNGLPHFLKLPLELRLDFGGPAKPTEEVLAQYSTLLESSLFAGLKGFQNSKYFNEFLKRKGIQLKNGFFDDPNVRSSVAGYLQQIFRNFSGQPLRNIQNASLKKALQGHGLANFDATKDSREILHSLSLKNTEQILQGKNHISDPKMAEVEKAVRDLDFDFVHNTNLLKTSSQSELLSSYWLEEIGFSGGLNTSLFNKHFLHSDDQVFFFIYPTKRGVKTGEGSEYGSDSIHLKSRYAAENGWISAFVMYPTDLMKASKTLRLKEYDQLRENFENISEHSREQQSEFLMDHVEIAQKMKNQLYRLDFTVADFSHWVKTQLLISLKDLKSQNPTEYENAIGILRSGDFRKMNGLLRRYVFGPLGIVGEFELKIPVAVPLEGIWK